jgi:hypothetical protein
MSDSIKKWEELTQEQEDRQRVIEQNGPSAIHYNNTPINKENVNLTGVVHGGAKCPSHHEEDEIATQSQVDAGADSIGKEVRWVYSMTFEDGHPSSGGYVNLGSSKMPTGTYETKLVDYVGFSVEKEESVEPDFKKITDSIASLLEYKNEKYGNSALEPMNIFQGKCKVGQRLDDKLARVKNGDDLKKNDIADLIGYLTLTCVENGWDNFDEFKD